MWLFNWAWVRTHTHNMNTNQRPIVAYFNIDSPFFLSKRTWHLARHIVSKLKGDISSLSYSCCCCCIASVVSDSVWPHRQQPTRLSRPWYSPGKNTGVGCHFLLQCMKVKSEREVAQSCPILSDPMDCSPPGSSIHGILQARVLECLQLVMVIWLDSSQWHINKTISGTSRNSL